MSLDIALEIGSYAKGKIIEIYGPKSSGKTTLTLHPIVVRLKKREAMLLLLMENNLLDPGYAKSVGVNFYKLLILQSDSVEKALDIGFRLIAIGKLVFW